MNFLSPKSQCQLCVAIDSTKRIYTLSHTLFADCSNMRPYSTSMSTIYWEQRCATHLQLIPEAHECTHSNCGAQSRHHQQTALSPVPPAKRPHQNAHAPEREVNAGGQHEPFDAHDYTTDPPVTKLPLQTDLNQLKGSEKCTFPAASGPCIERSAGAAALLTSGSFTILTRRRESSASALLDFVTWLAK